MPSKKPRCPNGYNRKPPKTGLCVKKADVKKKPKKKTEKKVCPQGKILNPKTNRCINDNPANRKRLSLKQKKPKSTINTIHCKKYKNIKNINLDNVKIVNVDSGSSRFFLVYKENGQTINLKNRKFLNSGSFGEVYEISNGDYKVAIKTYQDQDDDELKIVRKLNRMKLPCDVVNAKLLKTKDGYISVMDLMSGGLSKVNGKLNMTNNIRCIQEIAKDLKCLNDKKLSYTDLKTDNVLFKCEDKKNIKTVLGDLGGICKDGEYNACTWNPWEYRNELGFPKCCESTMVWCLGIILFELLKVDTDVFHWSQIFKYDADEVLHYIDDLCKNKRLNTFYVDKNKKIMCEKLLKDMLNFDPKKRITLNSIINKITL